MFRLLLGCVVVLEENLEPDLWCFVFRLGLVGCVSCMLTWHATGGLFVSVKTVIIWASDFMGALGLTGSIGPDSYWANQNSVLNKFYRSGAILGSIVTQLKLYRK